MFELQNRFVMTVMSVLLVIVVMCFNITSLGSNNLNSGRLRGGGGGPPIVDSGDNGRRANSSDHLKAKWRLGLDLRNLSSKKRRLVRELELLQENNKVLKDQLEVVNSQLTELSSQQRSGGNMELSKVVHQPQAKPQQQQQQQPPQGKPLHNRFKKNNAAVAEFGCPKMLWFCTVVWGMTGTFQSFNNLTLVALRSASVHAQGLVPVVIVYSPQVPINDPEYDQVVFLVEEVMGGVVMDLRVEDAYVWKFADIKKYPKAGSEVVASAVARLGVLDLLWNALPKNFPWFKAAWESGEISHDKIIYTDSDVTFMPSFTQCQWPSPKSIGMGPEIAKDQGAFNAGVVSINPENVTPEMMDDILTRGSASAYGGVDQVVLQAYFAEAHTDTRTQYPNRYNYKCQWGGPAKDASLIHFWGPKPGAGRGLDCAPNPRACKPPLPAHQFGAYSPHWNLAKKVDGHMFCNELVRHHYDYLKWPPFTPQKLGVAVAPQFNVPVIYVLSISPSLSNLPEAIVALRSQQQNAKSLIPWVYIPAFLFSNVSLENEYPAIPQHPAMQVLCQDYADKEKADSHSLSLCGMSSTEMVELLKDIVQNDLGGTVVPVPLYNVSISETRTVKSSIKFSGVGNSEVEAQLTADHLSSTFAKYDAVRRRKEGAWPADGGAPSEAEMRADAERLLFLSTDVVFTNDFDEAYIPKPLFVTLSERFEGETLQPPTPTLHQESSARPATSELRYPIPAGAVGVNVQALRQTGQWDRALWAWASSQTTNTTLQEIAMTSEHEVFGDFFANLSEEVERIPSRFLSTTCRPQGGDRVERGVDRKSDDHAGVSYVAKPDGGDDETTTSPLSSSADEQPQRRVSRRNTRRGRSVKNFTMVAHFGGLAGVISESTIKVATKATGSGGNAEVPSTSSFVCSQGWKLWKEVFHTARPKPLAPGQTHSPRPTVAQLPPQPARPPRSPRSPRFAGRKVFTRAPRKVVVEELEAAEPKEEGNRQGGSGTDGG